MSLLFVYGSMKKDFANEHQLKNATLLGLATTTNKYVMYPHVSYKFPCLYDDLEDNHIEGELYDVDENVLTQIDSFESVPILFQRKEIQIEFDHKIKSAFAYFCQLPKTHKNVDLKARCHEWSHEVADFGGIIEALETAFK